jgi:hypothetical protein
MNLICGVHLRFFSRPSARRGQGRQHLPSPRKKTHSAVMTRMTPAKTSKEIRCSWHQALARHKVTPSNPLHSSTRGGLDLICRTVELSFTFTTSTFLYSFFNVLDVNCLRPRSVVLSFPFVFFSFCPCDTLPPTYTLFSTRHLYQSISLAYQFRLLCRHNFLLCTFWANFKFTVFPCDGQSATCHVT